MAGKKKILVVDDEAIIARLIKQCISDATYEVVVASDGQEGLAAYQTQDICLVVSDIRMPNMSGKDLFYALRKLDPSAKIGFISAYGDKVTINELLSNGALFFVKKPFMIHDLKSKVHQALA